MKTHIIKDGPITDGIDVWTMFCGEQCLAMPDGHLIPDGFDFYNPKDGHKSDCQPCKDAMAHHHETREEVAA